ncbi:MAG: FG-GAP-like repeat-containing protein [Polyangiaceae bacterium]|nr:FG-GAP-like repeat-containing protein [Polyangiaceae bacterium]
MRNSAFLACFAVAMSFGFATGCGDGEEGGSGGSGTGGTGGTGGDGGKCPNLSFTAPTSGTKLGAGADKDGDCSNGIQVDVAVSTSAKDGAAATLRADGQSVGTATAAGSKLLFKDVQLASSGSTTLEVELDDDPSCTATIDVTSECGGAACEISKPVVSATHPELNGVPVAEGGDRVSAPGQDYQVAFEVKTTIEDGQPVTLTVDGKAQAAVALAQGGTAKFAGVTLVPDGDHEVSATCAPKVGSNGTSAKVKLPVDTTPPDLVNATPVDDTFIGPTEDVNPSKTGLQFKVCGESTAADAVDLPASLGAGKDNFCVAIGTASPQCSAAQAGAVGGKNGGCVELDCPGGAPFDLNVTLKDDAGNPTIKSLKGIRCASSLPGVQIIEPVDGTGSDVSKHILAATATQVRKDQDGTKAGAQYSVTACSNVAGTGTLRAGISGSTLTVVASNVATAPAQASDNCPAGYGHVVKFTNADLPDSTVTTDGKNALVAGTELEVEVTDVSTAKGKSPAVKVWVDSTAPNIYAWVPADLCGKLFQSPTDVTQNVVFGSTNSPVALTVTSNGTPANYTETSWANGFSTFNNVTFKVGSNDIAATTTEPSGNTAALKTPCAAMVGNPPVVTWTAPTQSSALNASTDGDGGTAGWQGAVSVQTDIGGSGATVTFTVTCGATETTLGTANVNASGVASLANVTLPECGSATLKATTSSVAGKGVGTSSLANKVVDTVAPSAATGITATVKDRRATSFTLSWTAPGDGSATVAGYDIRVSKSPITAGNFSAAEAVTYSGTPKAAGQVETLTVNGRVIETGYYFAVAAIDAGGNKGTIAATASAAKATFNQTILSGGTGERMGFRVDGASSINGDSLSDLIVGTAGQNKAYAWFGSATGYATAPSITFTGASGTSFGIAATPVGDIDGDGLVDVAIGASADAGRGRVYVFKGRANWAASYSQAQADYVIDVDPVADSKFTASSFGVTIAALGDFDGDGPADFAVAAYFYGVSGARQGYVAVIRGVPTGQTFPATVTLPADVGTRAIAYVGEAGNNQFGLAITSMGGFYGGSKSAMVVGAPLGGKVYSFQGGTGTTGTIQAGTAKEIYTGSVALRTGNPVTHLGASGVGVGSPGLASNAGGDARLFFGNGTTVFSASATTFSNSAAPALGDRFGNAVFGSAFSGSAVAASWIGGAGVDIAMSSVAENGGPARLYLAEASKLTASGDIVALADIVVPLPSGWVGSSSGSSSIRDCDGDGYGDIAVGEHLVTATPYDGRVLVLW